MDAFARRFLHEFLYQVRPILGTPIHAGPKQKMSARLLSRPEQLEDVRLAIANVDAALGYAQKLSGLLEILQPPNAFLLLYWNSCRIDVLLESVGSLEFIP